MDHLVHLRLRRRQAQQVLHTCHHHLQVLRVFLLILPILYSLIHPLITDATFLEDRV